MKQLMNVVEIFKLSAFYIACCFLEFALLVDYQTIISLLLAYSRLLISIS